MLIRTLLRKCSSRLGVSMTQSSNSSRHLCTQTGSKLQDKVVLITGAATGIGRTTASKFIANGAKVIIADTQKDLGHKTAQQLGPNATFIHCDVSSEAQVSQAVDFAVSEHNQLDIMYNNAGVACQTPHSIVDLDLAAFDRVMSVNARGVLAGIKHAARAMIPRGKGVILCTASVTGIMGGLAQHTYSVSKSCVVGIVRSTASELCRHGIRVNCISPMVVPTTNMVMEELRKYFPGVDDGRLVKMMHDQGLLKGAVCEEVDIANAALYLASDDAKYVHGHNLVVDGGFTKIKSLNMSLS